MHPNRHLEEKGGNLARIDRFWIEINSMFYFDRMSNACMTLARFQGRTHGRDAAANWLAI